MKMGKIVEKAEEKYLRDEDKILNLKEINIMAMDSFSSSSCSGSVSFYIDCETEQGIVKILILLEK